MFIISFICLSVLFIGCESHSATSTCTSLEPEGGHNTCATGTSIVNVDYPRTGDCDSVESDWRDCDTDANRESCRSTCESLAVTSNLDSGCCSFRAHLASGNNGIDPSTGKYGCLYYEGSQEFVGDGNVDIYAGMCTTTVDCADLDVDRFLDSCSSNYDGLVDGVVANAADCAANTGDIGTNAANIAGNTAEIAALGQRIYGLHADVTPGLFLDFGNKDLLIIGLLVINLAVIALSTYICVSGKASVKYQPVKAYCSE